MRRCEASAEMFESMGIALHARHTRALFFGTALGAAFREGRVARRRRRTRADRAETGALRPSPRRGAGGRREAAAPRRRSPRAARSGRRSRGRARGSEGSTPWVPLPFLWPSGLGFLGFSGLVCGEGGCGERKGLDGPCSHASLAVCTSLRDGFSQLTQTPRQKMGEGRSGGEQREVGT